MVKANVDYHNFRIYPCALSYFSGAKLPSYIEVQICCVPGFPGTRRVLQVKPKPPQGKCRHRVCSFVRPEVLDQLHNICNLEIYIPRSFYKI